MAIKAIRWIADGELPNGGSGWQQQAHCPVLMSPTQYEKEPDIICLLMELYNTLIK